MKKLFSLLSVLCVAGLGVGLLAACDDEEEDVPGDDGSVTEPEHTHSYDGGVVTKEATCTDVGVMTYTCECGDSYTEPIPALGHDYTAIEYVATGEAEENAGWYYVCSRCGEVGQALENQESPLAGGEVVASTAEGLKAALEAVNSATEGEVVITLTGDIEAEGLEISGDNVTLTGEGELTLTDSIEVSGSDVTLDGLTIDATGVDEDSEGGSAAVKVTGDSTTISDCTIVGGGENSSDASILIVPAAASSEVTISGCDISGAYRGVFVNRGESVDLEISECEIHASYTINITGSNASSVLTVSDCGLYGWTSFAAVGEASFTNCTFGFSDSVGTTKVTGGFRPYSDVTLEGCHFCSLDSSGITLVGDQTNDTIEYLAIKSNNYGISVGKDNVKITLINCTYDKSGEEGWTTETLSEENVINIMCDKSGDSNCDFTYRTGSGFVFSLEDPTTVWTLGALTTAGYGVPTTSGDTGNDES